MPVSEWRTAQGCFARRSSIPWKESSRRLHRQPRRHVVTDNERRGCARAGRVEQVNRVLRFHDEKVLDERAVRANGLSTDAANAWCEIASLDARHQSLQRMTKYVCTQRSP